MPLILLLVGELELVKRHVDAVTLRNMSDDLVRQHQAHKSPNIVVCIKGEFMVNAGAVLGGIIIIDGEG
jgi:hypothetical protein